jgi:ribosomal 50S subunit-recycling heat shock protein
VDVFLHWTCVAKSRSEAGSWCHEGHVRLDGTLVKASHAVRAGQKLEISLSGRTARYEILDVPARPSSRAQRDRFVKAV